ncbi:EF-hand domain-containing protein [Asticcacaulis sp. AND118]|uniref:EF-hand domain-containing protein n=1 Tax=Asticcacaulis sp. AND118 TaxID=2840468 RepID=UPI001CFFB021|nr:EF-hand domain-containing protein [Asticcacaulis sp. AND118]UDF04982.1 EF-hand domain-containing protein [Asticcacaulis sp. AND118]
MTLRNIKILFSLLFPLAAASGAVLAQSDDSPGARFATADANRDGSTTRAEWESYRMSQFDRVDRNRDGFISAADVPRFLQNSDRAQKLQDTIRHLDQNGDAKLSRAEFTNAPALGFEKYDLNKNGVIDPLEREAAR